MKGIAKPHWGLLLILGGAISCTTPTETHFPERTFRGPWSMNAGELEHLKVNVAKIEIGEDVGQVVNLLGAPDRDYTVKKNDKNGFFIYYVTRQRADSPVESDKRVTIAFNGQNKVKAISSNVEDIRSRNWP